MILLELDIEKHQLDEVLSISRDFDKFIRRYSRLPDVLKGATLGMIFEEPSLRTRTAFEVAMRDLGGNVVVYKAGEVRLGRTASKTENLSDFKRVLSGFVDILLCRIYDNAIQTQLAEGLSIPYINGMCNLHHPSQALCDIFTIENHFGSLEGIKVAFIGDATNVAYSLAQGLSRYDTKFVLSCPEEFRPLLGRFQQLPNFEYEEDPAVAVKDADVIVGDSWFPMNQKFTEARAALLTRYKITSEIVKLANSGHIFMHNLPADRTLEVTPEVIDGEHSVIIEEAVSRRAIARGLLYYMSKGIK